MRPRLTPALGLVLCVFLAVAAFVLSALVSDSVSELSVKEEEQVLRSQVLLLEEAMGSQLEGVEPAEVRARVQRLGDTTGVRFTLIRQDGEVLADSQANPAVMDNHATRPEVVAALTHDFGTSRRTSKTLGGEFLYVAKAVRRDGALLGWIRGSIRSAELRSRMSVTQWVLCASAVIAASGALLAGGLSAITLLRSKRPAVPSG